MGIGLKFGAVSQEKVDKIILGFYFKERGRTCRCTNCVWYTNTNLWKWIYLSTQRLFKKFAYTERINVHHTNGVNLMWYLLIYVLRYNWLDKMPDFQESCSVVIFETIAMWVFYSPFWARNIQYVVPWNGLHYWSPEENLNGQSPCSFTFQIIQTRQCWYSGV